MSKQLEAWSPAGGGPEEGMDWREWRGTPLKVSGHSVKRYVSVAGFYGKFTVGYETFVRD